jgi:hypothetical protein
MTERNTVKRGRGRPAKPIANPSVVIKAVIKFLQIFVTETLAKRIVGIVLIAAGISNARITAETGLSDRSIWRAKKAINSGNIDDLFMVGHGSGRNGNAKGFETAIVEELEKNNYHTRQQVADMILEKWRSNVLWG